MPSLISILNAALVLSAPVLSSPVAGQVTTKSFVTCVTNYGTKSTSPVKTVSAVATVPWVAKKYTTVKPQTTVTPRATTTTLSETETSTTTLTLPQETDTYTSTTTLSFEETSTVTTTSTTTTTTTTTTTISGTTTIPAPAGFVPIESSIPGAMKRSVQDANDAIVETNALEERGASSFKCSRGKNGKKTWNKPQYPQNVKCAGFVALVSTSTITVTAKKTHTITASTPTSSVTTTITSTSTTTEIPIDASTTLTSTESTTTTVTSTTTATTTSTTTATVSISQPVATSYAACADNNIINQRNGQAISAWGGSGSYSTSSPANAYDCCVQCQTSGNCFGALYMPGLCYIYIASGATCDPAGQGATVWFGETSDFTWQAIGGPCGTSTSF